MNNKNVTKRSTKKRRAARLDMPTRQSGKTRATVHTHADRLRAALYEGYDAKTGSQNRTDFVHFLSNQYDMNLQTAYGKMGYWRIKEWEVAGFKGVIEDYCLVNNLIPPSWGSEQTTDDAAALSEVIDAVREWFAPLRHKMRFYNFLAERGMCRSYFTRIMNKEATMTRLRIEGLQFAFIRWVNEATNERINSILHRIL